MKSEDIMPVSPSPTGDTPQVALPQKTIIVISRQYGSGGREVGSHIANKLGIAYYDKELIALAARKSGLSEEYLEKEGERVTNPIAYMFSYAGGSGATKEDTLPISDRGFLAQAKLIKQIAHESSCVIVGRCADYVLDGFEEFTSVFIHGSWESRIARVMERNNITSREVAITRIKKTDKNRAAYYSHYTDKRWGRADNYDLAVSTSHLEVEDAADLVIAFLQLKKQMK